MVVGNRQRLLLLIAACAVLFGCSFKLKIDLFNHSGGEAEIRLGNSVVPLSLGQRARFYYPVDAEAWQVRVISAGCIYIYALPKVVSDRPVKLPPDEALPMQ